MNSRAVLRALAPALALMPLAACVSHSPRLADSRGTSLHAVCDAEPVTGTRIRSAADGNCKPSNSPFKTYSADDLLNTGEGEISSALRELDGGIR